MTARQPTITISIVCSPEQLAEVQARVSAFQADLYQPGAVFSVSTKRVDRGEKLEAYRRIPTLETYVLVSQGERRVERHWREGEAWHLEVLIGDGVVPFPCVGVELSLDDIYGRR